MESAIIRSHRSGIIRRLADLGPWIIPIVSRVRVEMMCSITLPRSWRRSTSRPHIRSRHRRHLGLEISRRRTEPDRPRTRRAQAARGPPYQQGDRGELFIAPATVKKRTVTLYNKLNVHGRHEAVVKARALGYLSD